MRILKSGLMGAAVACALLVSIHPAHAASNCGNGQVQAGEQCDDGGGPTGNGTATSCCNVDCTFAATTKTCRAATNAICDVAETCTGTSAACPADTFASAATVCRTSTGVCDPAESCTGTSGACPADAKSTSVCRASGGVCDIAESCDGTNGACPADAKSNAVCRPSAGVCDLGAEICDGTNNNCPADSLLPSSTVCRASGGVCDPAENCTGTSAACPADAKSSAICRTSTGICDPSESCDGTSNNCPADAKSTSVCRTAAGVCDVAESCDGTNGACPADAKSNAVCRPSAGVCDAGAETCDGVSNNCPADVPASAGTVCRTAAGNCDIQETCNGASSSCPADVKSTSLCRASGGVCDLAESCDGVNNDCPADAKSTAVCRPAVSENCDVAESCDGTNNDCPADQLIGCKDDDGVDCTVAACGIDGKCTIADNCVEICRGFAFWKNHSGYEKNGENVGQSVLDDTPLLVCGQDITQTVNIGNLDSMLEALCIRVQGVEQRKLYRQLVTAALNCSISEGGTCDQITAKFMELKYSDCDALCTGDPVGQGVTMKACIDQLTCFNNGGRVINGECAEGTCEVDTQTYCGDDFGDCPTIADLPQACVKFPDSCSDAQLCSEDLEAPAKICPHRGPASSPQICHDAKQNSCNIDGCF